MARIPALPEATPIGALSAHLRRPRPRSATSAIRRLLPDGKRVSRQIRANKIAHVPRRRCECAGRLKTLGLDPVSFQSRDVGGVQGVRLVACGTAYARRFPLARPIDRRIRNVSRPSASIAARALPPYSGRPSARKRRDNRSSGPTDRGRKAPTRVSSGISCSSEPITDLAPFRGIGRCRTLTKRAWGSSALLSRSQALANWHNREARPHH